MHPTSVKMKDGREFSNPIWSFKPEEGFMTIWDVDEKLYFKDMASAITIDYSPEKGFYNVDEIKRAEEVLLILNEIKEEDKK
jgi:hypothetical protein